MRAIYDRKFKLCICGSRCSIGEAARGSSLAGKR